MSYAKNRSLRKEERERKSKKRRERKNGKKICDFIASLVELGSNNTYETFYFVFSINCCYIIYQFLMMAYECIEHLFLFLSVKKNHCTYVTFLYLGLEFNQICYERRGREKLTCAFFINISNSCYALGFIINNNLTRVRVRRSCAVEYSKYLPISKFERKRLHVTRTRYRIFRIRNFVRLSVAKKKGKEISKPVMSLEER